jgi:type VI protein secretion system component VasK
MSMRWTLILGLTAFFTLVGIPFTLWWWKMADKWADEEKRRFKAKTDERERVVIKSDKP